MRVSLLLTPVSQTFLSSEEAVSLTWYLTKGRTTVCGEYCKWAMVSGIEQDDL